MLRFIGRTVLTASSKTGSRLELLENAELIQEVQEEGFALGTHLRAERIARNRFPKCVAKAPTGLEPKVHANGGAPIGVVADELVRW